MEVLEDLAKSLTDTKQAHRAGVMAADFIRSHLYKGDGFTALSAATIAYRGAGMPLQDTGSLRDSIASEVTGPSSVSVGTNKVYAAIHNFGGTIKPKKAKFLLIPGPDTRRLQRRYGYKTGDLIRGLEADGYPVFRVNRTLCYETKGRGKKKVLKVLFYMKRSVVIPKREYFYLTDKEINMIGGEIIKT